MANEKGNQCQNPSQVVPNGRTLALMSVRIFVSLDALLIINE